MDNGDLENDPFCSVKELGKTSDKPRTIRNLILGRNAYMLFNNYYEEPKRIVFNGKRNGIKLLENRKDSKMANKAQLLGQLATLKVNSKKMSSNCNILKSLEKRNSGSKNLLMHKIGNITKVLAKNFAEMNHEAKLEGEQVSLILQIASQLVGTIINDKKIMKMIMKLVKKDNPQVSNNPGNGFGNNGNGNGFGNGFNPGRPNSPTPTSFTSSAPSPSGSRCIS